jgi:nucleoside-diphosphate-sugar epimerase
MPLPSAVMRVLLIGGSGFLSSHVFDACLAARHDVAVVTRGQRPVRAGARAIVADRNDRDAFARAIADAGATWDLVIDGIGYSAADAQQDVDVLLPRCAQLVFVSTDFVYAREGRPFPVTEAFDRFETAIAYGRSKREAERVLLEAPRRAAVTILRPGHIYGSGSQLGCLPGHGRDAKLIERLRTGETLQLVGNGHFLQQPVYAPDLARTILSCAGNAKASGEVFHAAGPDVIESRTYYDIVASHLGVEAKIEETSVTQFLAGNPDRGSFCCHRVYSMDKARAAGLVVPSTLVADGLREHVRSLLETAKA